MCVSHHTHPLRHDSLFSCAGSRTEEGCFRFDLLQDQSNPNKFVFYEVYKDAATIDVHKTFDHYKAWADFKAGGGVLSQEVMKTSAVDFSG